MTLALAALWLCLAARAQDLDSTDVPPTEVSQGGAPSAQEQADSKSEKQRVFGSARGFTPKPDRTEVIAFPVFAQTPDVGVMVGIGGGLARFRDNRYKPYSWSVAASAIVSFRKFDGRFRLLMQEYALSLDLPQRADGRLRASPSFSYLRVPNAAYYGIGNDGQYYDAPSDDSTYYRFEKSALTLFVPVRYTLRGPWSLLMGLTYRYTDMNTYEGSLLEAHIEELVDDRGDPLIPGFDKDHELISAVGVMFDTRDWELDPQRGLWLETSVRHTRGVINGTNGYTGFDLDLRGYYPLVPERLVLAGRVMADVLLGDVAFFEYEYAGAFPRRNQIGGSKGIRGVPEGRFRGQSKFLAQVELRSWILEHLLFGNKVRAGLAAFFDSGRVWAVSGYNLPTIDGTGLGLRYGLGGGARLGWGEYGIVRFDLAWSPFGAENGPVGFYVDVGHTF